MPPDETRAVKAEPRTDPSFFFFSFHILVSNIDFFRPGVGFYLVSLLYRFTRREILL